RAAAVRGLQKLSRVLRRVGWCASIEFRRRAKVPVLALRHANGVEADVSWGRPAAALDAFVSSLDRKYPIALRPLAIVLKVLLRQRGLDKPFSGGLGSFRLYVMLASWLDRQQAAGRGSAVGRDLGAALVNFLMHFGHRARLNRETRLSANGREVGFSGVFRCNEVATTLAAAAAAL
ncbi:unnamed protein product, partial [Phaeothamnion confervicola]